MKRWDKLFQGRSNQSVGQFISRVNNVLALERVQVVQLNNQIA